MTKVLIASMPSAGTAILSHELFSEPEPLGIISIESVSARSMKSMLMTGTEPAAGGVLVLARDRMHDRGAQRMLAASRARSPCTIACFSA